MGYLKKIKRAVMIVTNDTHSGLTKWNIYAKVLDLDTRETLFEEADLNTILSWAYNHDYEICNLQDQLGVLHGRYNKKIKAL